tara:strand:- start:6803 stop:8575 length:1773 start_codon:yes stop_codon:yes gene_type:complete
MWVVRASFLGTIVVSWWLSHASSDSPEPASMEGLAFEEVAHEIGIDFVHATTTIDPSLAHIHPQIVGTGASVSAVDFDDDGWLDLYTTTMGDGAGNGLFRNLGDGTFEDVASSVGLADLNRAGVGVSHGSIWADVDQDGDQDVFVYKWGRSQLFLQGADGRFVDVTADAGLDHWMNCATAIWFDFDKDGWLDLFQGGYYRETTNLWDVETTKVLHEDGEFAYNGGRNFLFRGLGPDADGVLRFANVSDETGIGGGRWTYGAASADFNRDGWPDLYLANDYGAEELFLNQGGKSFVAAEGLGLDLKSKSGMCVAVGDVTNNGDLAVFVTNVSESGWLFQGNNLRVSQLPEEHRLDNLCLGTHAAQDCGWAWGADFGDLDNDGDQDLMVVNGFRSANPDRSYWYQMDKVGGATGRLLEDAANWPPFEDKSLSGFQRSRVLLTQGRRRRYMVEVGEKVGITDRLDGRAVVLADLFNDGTLDAVVANQEGPLLVYRNQRPVDDKWIGWKLKGSVGNPDAIGAHVVAHFGDQTQVQVVTAGCGFCSQTDPRLHFGLGEHGAPTKVEIRWPSGRTTEIEPEALQPGRYHVIQEPTS